MLHSKRRKNILSVLKEKSSQKQQHFWLYLKVSTIDFLTSESPLHSNEFPLKVNECSLFEILVIV